MSLQDGVRVRHILIRIENHAAAYFYTGRCSGREVDSRHGCPCFNVHSLRAAYRCNTWIVGWNVKEARGHVVSTRRDILETIATVAVRKNHAGESHSFGDRHAGLGNGHGADPDICRGLPALRETSR